MSSTIKYVAYCPNHNWEGMRRDDQEEAEKDLDGHKGWFPSESHSDSGIREEDIALTKPEKFYVSVINENELAVTVGLCTGEEFVIPHSVISNFSLLGTSKSGDISKPMASLLIDDSTAEGKLIYDLCKSLKRSSDSQKGDKSAFKSTEEFYDTHPIRVQGTACNTDFTYYDTTFNISGFSLQRAEECSVLEVIKTGAKQLRIKHITTSGTQCGLGYGAKVYIDIW